MSSPDKFAVAKGVTGPNPISPSSVGDAAGGSDNSTNVYRVSIRTPTFCRDRPALWFCSLEAQFHINNITHESTKFHYAVAHLDVECTKEVEDIITQPSKTIPYTQLKNAIIARFSDSYEEKVRRLLENEPMGDRKPTSFLRHLRSLAGATFPEQLLKTIWSKQLPQQLQIVLAAQKQQSLQELCDLADQLMEINLHSSILPAVNEVHHASSVEFRALQKQVQELTVAVASLASGRNARSRERGSSQRRGRSASGQSSKLCWYHDKFGEKANKCVNPCSWSDQPSGNSKSGP